MKHKQAPFYRIISQSMINNKMSHAYLLVGETQLLESAYWLAGVIMSQSLDDKKINAKIEELKTIDKVDFKLIDGSKKQIKKEEISDLQVMFQNTALEESNQKVVILHHVDKATLSALNALLKFLEEPSGQTTSFILTAERSELVLPTIYSRCMVIQLDRDETNTLDLEGQHEIVINHLSQSGYTQEILEDVDYQEAANVAVDFFTQLPLNFNLACLNLQLNPLSNRQSALYLSEILCEHSRALLYNKSEPSSFTLNQIKGMIKVFTQFKNNLNPSTNIPLLVDELCYKMQEVFNDN